MSEWDGRPQGPDRAAWHWLLLHGDDEPTVCDWLPKRQMWHLDAGIFDPAYVATQADYLGPCHAPAEVAALVAAAGREGMERGYDLGFAASGEGWNGEYPPKVQQREGYAQVKASALRAAMREAPTDA